MRCACAGNVLRNERKNNKREKGKGKRRLLVGYKKEFQKQILLAFQLIFGACVWQNYVVRVGQLRMRLYDRRRPGRQSSRNRSDIDGGRIRARNVVLSYNTEIYGQEEYDAVVLRRLGSPIRPYLNAGIVCV